MSSQNNKPVNKPQTTAPKRRFAFIKVLRNTAIVLGIFTLIGGPISGITTYANLGMTPTFLADWRSSFFKSLLVMLPAAYLLMFIVDRYVKRLFLNLPPIKQNIINGLIFGTLMQAVVTAVTTANNVGFTSSIGFLPAWIQGFASALPLGIVISVIMTTVIKPRLEVYMAS